MNIHNPLSPSTKPGNGRVFTLLFFIFSFLLFFFSSCSRREAQMREALLQAKEQNQAYIPFTTDSVLREVVAYYDRHGTPNDRLLARYLLLFSARFCLKKSSF